MDLPEIATNQIATIRQAAHTSDFTAHGTRTAEETRIGRPIFKYTSEPIASQCSNLAEGAAQNGLAVIRRRDGPRDPCGDLKFWSKI